MLKWLKRKAIGIGARVLAGELKSADIPLLNRFLDLMNEMSLTDALNQVGKEFDWPVSSGLAIDRLKELGIVHLGEYGPMFVKFITTFRRQFDTEKKENK